jgi:hypothetical protein
MISTPEADDRIRLVKEYFLKGDAGDPTILEIGDRGSPIVYRSEELLWSQSQQAKQLI